MPDWPIYHFHEGVYSTSFKTASVTPILKKKGLDDANLTNYRPISNLNTISKILERIVMLQLIKHVENSTSFNPYQSAYRKGYSTETALLKLLNDIYNAADCSKRSLLLLLDLSAAFDCIDINILLRRLNHSFGISETALHWIASYLNDRHQFVRIGTEQSNSVSCDYGVPQGSVLGPLLFSLYVAPVATVIARFGINHIQYADDTQLYLNLSSGNDHVAISGLLNCFEALTKWYAVNGLQLNAEKTDGILLGTAARLRNDGVVSGIRLSTASDLVLASTVKTLGVTLDSSLSFNKHIDNICQASRYHIAALRHIRKCVNTQTAKEIAAVIVGSRLDYCNSLLYGTSKANVHKLQLIQNSLARVVMLKRKNDHISNSLRELHWLPVEARIKFKLAVITYRALSTSRPSYLASMLSFYTPSRSLRSMDSRQLVVPRTKTKFAGNAFAHSAPVLWNTLPDNLRCSTHSLATFKKSLKTHLYEHAFSC